MLLEWRDFNGAKDFFAGPYKAAWDELYSALSEMPLHLKASDQARIQGTLIFDPVGTNDYIKKSLINYGWEAKVPIPQEYKVLGTDVDFMKTQVLAEAQFSNYPFLYNNIFRSQLFHQNRTPLGGYVPEVLVIISKGSIFPASQSTLYFEQAVELTGVLSGNRIFDMPVRVMGLQEQVNTVIDAIFTTYHLARTSRTIVTQVRQQCSVSLRPRSTRGAFTLLNE